jgi:hypothetical protein
VARSTNPSGNTVQLRGSGVLPDVRKGDERPEPVASAVGPGGTLLPRAALTAEAVDLPVHQGGQAHRSRESLRKEVIQRTHHWGSSQRAANDSVPSSIESNRVDVEEISFVTVQDRADCGSTIGISPLGAEYACRNGEKS